MTGKSKPKIGRPTPGVPRPDGSDAPALDLASVCEAVIADPASSPGDRLRAAERLHALRGEGPDGLDEVALVFARRIRGLSDGELDAEIDGLFGGAEWLAQQREAEIAAVVEARLAARAESAALDREVEMRARVLAGKLAEGVAGELFEAARARVGELEARVAEFEAGGGPRVKPGVPPSGIDPRLGWAEDRWRVGGA